MGGINNNIRRSAPARSVETQIQLQINIRRSAPARSVERLLHYGIPIPPHLTLTHINQMKMETKIFLLAITGCAIALSINHNNFSNPTTYHPKSKIATFAKPPTNLKKGKYSIFVDYSQPIDSIRLWLINNKTGDTLMRSTCSHGYASGPEILIDPSNISGSHKSSIGNFIIAEKYVGTFGNSIRLDGISGKLNSNARSRNIIIHSTKKLATKWTWGCFAVPEDEMKTLYSIDLAGCILYAYL